MVSGLNPGWPHANQALLESVKLFLRRWKAKGGKRINHQGLTQKPSSISIFLVNFLWGGEVGFYLTVLRTLLLTLCSGISPGRV